MSVLPLPSRLTQRCFPVTPDNASSACAAQGSPSSFAHWTQSRTVLVWRHALRRRRSGSIRREPRSSMNVSCLLHLLSSPTSLSISSKARSGSEMGTPFPCRGLRPNPCLSSSLKSSPACVTGGKPLYKPLRQADIFGPQSVRVSRKRMLWVFPRNARDVFPPTWRPGKRSARYPRQASRLSSSPANMKVPRPSFSNQPCWT